MAEIFADGPPLVCCVRIRPGGRNRPGGSIGWPQRRPRCVRLFARFGFGTPWLRIGRVISSTAQYEAAHRHSALLRRRWVRRGTFCSQLRRWPFGAEQPRRRILARRRIVARRRIARGRRTWEVTLRWFVSRRNNNAA